MLPCLFRLPLLWFSVSVQAGFPSPVDRQIVVAMNDGEFTVKRFRRMNGRVFLEAANDSFPKLELGEDQELTIWGAVTYVIHRAR